MMPPLITVGSSPPASSSAATSEVVVVLPWVPAMATQHFSRISSASISARRTTGSRLARAATSSGLSRLMAEETTTTSAPSIFSASWPMATVMPLLAQALDVGAVGDVGAADGVAEIGQHLGDAAHADAADADEMHRADVARQFHDRSCPCGFIRACLVTRHGGTSSNPGDFQHQIGQPLGGVDGAGRFGGLPPCGQAAPGRRPGR